MLTVAYLRIKM